MVELVVELALVAGQGQELGRQAVELELAVELAPAFGREMAPGQTRSVASPLPPVTGRPLSR